MEERHDVRVLLAEDDEAMRSMLRSIFEARGLSVTEARDGGEARALILATAASVDPRPAYTVIVSDLAMAGASGLELLSLSWGLVPRPAFVLITSLASDRLRREALERGADAVFDKPLDPRQLADAVVQLATGTSRTQGAGAPAHANRNEALVPTDGERE